MRFRRILLGAAVFIVLMFTVPHFMATTSGAYKLAVATAHGAPRFTDVLGAPVREAWFSEGKVFGDPATAELLIPVQGSKRVGSLRVAAIKGDGHWRLTKLILELAQPDERIDLLPRAGTAHR
jgi:hypothetical protein